MFQFLQNLMGSSSGTEDLQEIIQSGAVLVDVRSPGEFAMGSAPGAINIPVDQIGARSGQLKDKGNIVVFCRSGNRSAQAKAVLESKGLSRVFNGGTWNRVAQLAKKP